MTIKPARLGGLLLSAWGQDHGTVYENCFVVSGLAFCIVGCIGMLEGFKRANLEKIPIGIVIGVCLAFVEVLIMGFVGCCQTI
ncbi:MAG TPA: hypothetical protein VG754_00090 [Verrucomicrobiae bacterium]|nr:hypothetical protein [Verrucomicrobiae bacterium]